LKSRRTQKNHRKFMARRVKLVTLRGFFFERGIMEVLLDDHESIKCWIVGRVLRLSWLSRALMWWRWRFLGKNYRYLYINLHQTSQIYSKISTFLSNFDSKFYLNHVHLNIQL
jgi:hypothetical protein